MIDRDADVHDCPYCAGRGWIVLDFTGDTWVCWDCSGQGEVCNLCGAPWRNGHSCSIDAEDVETQAFWNGL